MKVCISGCSGRMGGELVKVLDSSPYAESFQIVSGLVTDKSKHVGEDLGNMHGIGNVGVYATADLEEALSKCEIVIDFSRPENTVALAQACAKNGVMLVAGTTGFNEAQIAELHHCAKNTRILWSSNTSLSVNAMLGLLEVAAKVLGEEFDIEILDLHHNKKVDAPSGTAIMMGNAIASAKGWNANEAFVLDRNKDCHPRGKKEIGFASVRAGGIIGEHKAIFASDNEIIEISSKILNRNVWAIGALKAATWLATQQPGRLFAMKDVLGL